MKNKKMTWIAVSGLDGSGKTTLVSNLREWIENEHKLRVMQSRLPNDEHLVKDLLNVSNDRYTDRMLFALDNRIFAERLRQWENSNQYDILITQRCFLDSFVHGAVQEFSYQFIGELNHIEELPKCDVIIHLVAEAETAFDRIKNDPDADKFEYIEYIRKQEQETRKAYREIITKSIDLSAFHECRNIYIDTTQMTTQETFEIAKKKLIELDIF